MRKEVRGYRIYYYFFLLDKESPFQEHVVVFLLILRKM